jgi:nucleoside-diphosphate-sugar epimerase
MRVFIIGATGYIGGVFAERLLSNGHQVVGTARTPEAAEKLRKAGVKPYEGTLDQASGLLPAVSEADAIIYAAYRYDNEKEAENEIKTRRTHISEILEVMTGLGKTFVLTSGTGVLGDTGDRIYEENTPLLPSSAPVTLARRALEQEVLSAAKKGVRSIVLRPPVVYGRGGSLLIPNQLLDYALRSGMSIYIEGTEENKWSTVHIDDLADLFMKAIDQAQPGSLWHTSSESGITTRSIAEAISRVAGLNGKTTSITAEEAKELFGRWASFWALNNQSSAQKAMDVLHWRPTRPSMLADIEHGSYAIRCMPGART